jgi:hypothetical protein
MTKLTNYLVTVTDTKETLAVSSGQSTPANSNRITISEDSGGFSFGTVGVTPTFCLADSSPVLTNPDGKCPVYQDLIPRTVFSGIVNTFLISATGTISSPVINCTYSEFSYLISVAASTGATTGTTILTGSVTPNITLKGTSVRLVYFGASIATPGVDYNVIAYNGNPAPFAIGYIQIELLKPIVSGTPYNIIFNAQFNAIYGTFTLSEAVYGNDGCYGPFTNNQPDAAVCTYVVPSTTTTTTSTTTCNPTPNWQNTGFSCYGGCNKYNVQTDQNPCSPTYNTTRQGSLVESNSTYCGGCCGQSTTANWQDTGIYNCYGTCNLYYEQQDINPCSSTFGQTRQGSLYQTNSTSCGGCCGQSTTPNWVDNGAAYCDSCVSKQPQIDNNPCSSSYNQTRVINAGSACNTTQNWVNTGSYNCYGTCNKYNVEVQNNPCASGYNTTRQGSVAEFNSTFCGGCCGQSTAANWVNSGSYNCYGSCTKYNVEVDNNGCSPTYNQTRQGSAVEFNSSFCGGCCGSSPSANWVNNGSTYCDGCYLQQPQIDDNPCSSTYGDTRNVDLGVNTACGAWVQSFYCVGYDKWSKETNTCTGSIRDQYLVEVNSAYCGYVPPPACRTYQIVGDYTDESVNGIYTNCSGGSDSFSFFGGPGTVGYICALAGSVYVTSGNGSANDVGGC